MPIFEISYVDALDLSYRSASHPMKKCYEAEDEMAADLQFYAEHGAGSIDGDCDFEILDTKEVEVAVEY